MIRHMSALVGRVGELAALAEVARVAAGDQVAAAVIIGDPGSGKSRLLAEAAARADVTDQFRIVGYEPEREVPLAAASDFLRALTIGRSLRACRCLGPRLLGHAFRVERRSSGLWP